MSDEKKPFAHMVPALLTGIAALLAALTTVYVNVRGDQPRPERTVVVAAPAAPAAAPARTTPERLQLQVDRIAVQHDGSVGTTDWRFEVQVEGEPLFVFGQDDLDETGGRNVARPEDASGTLRLAPGQRAQVLVHGWRGSRFRVMPGTPDVEGRGVLSAAGALAPITVKGARPADGAFVFYLSAVAD